MNWFLYLKSIFFIFFFYSVLGWVIEVINSLINNKRIVNRGFLIGPYCPIYGFGCLLITLLLKDNVNDFVTLFLKSILICSVLEYFTSFIMEKIFKYRWWDYSNRKFNINGRICLETTIPFGLGACAIMYLINPIVFKLINSINPIIATILFFALFLIMILDLIVSIYFVKNIKGVEKNSLVDSTRELKEKMKKMIKHNKKFYKRIFISFPDLSSTNKK